MRADDHEAEARGAEAVVDLLAGVVAELDLEVVVPDRELLGDERKKELDGKSNGVLRRWAMNNAVRYLWTLLDVGALPRATPAGTTDA